MSDDAPTSRVSTIDGAQDRHDHEISLIDTTVSDVRLQDSRTGSQSPRWRSLARNPTKSSVKDQLARRKYAKWREDKYSSKTKDAAAGDGDDTESVQPETETIHTLPGQNGKGTEAVDFAKSVEVDRGRKKGNAKPHAGHKKHKEAPYEVDILYENQRGAFLCGIPLYSHSSLLNFDPGPWVTREFKDSAVNITNAQVPDPSWEWAWKTWYVDMSYDVDEEGWQYSFTFGKNFAWHGTHPWFHSFVRRRRWLRKRVKRNHAVIDGKADTLRAAHQLTTDYFTIHPKRDQSPGSAIDGASKSGRPDSYTSIAEVEAPPEEIHDIATLLKALRLAAIDREKIDLVKKFIDQGGEELAYLGSHIPEIMSFLVFQNSRRQLLLYLKETAKEAQQHRDEHDAEQKPEGDIERRRIDNILAAIDAADKQISGLEYWSDRKHVLKTEGDNTKVKQISTIFDVPAAPPKPEDNPVDNIKGISSRAEVEIDPNDEVVYGSSPAQQHSESVRSDKGKGKSKEATERETVEDDNLTRLGPDQIFIPDEE